ncbi:restriction endonuclease subunit S [Vibrio diabolicus]|uniref:restriction endonuclease subunit S n=1 Tax=Vibrio diabolicus TaxID=50719 RepID=UPI002940FCA2|nr:restriction endonuclease subunit S [Vibrio diabolicus]MDV5060151.1 restriction endonuclease subunit S [Vibrio diabolicus]
MGKYHAYQVYEDTHNEFVSELPQGWVLSKFKYEVDYVEGPGILANDFHEAGIPLLRIQNVKDRFTSGDIKTYLDPQKVKDKWEHFKTKTGDLLISGSASTDLVTEVTEQYEGAVPYTGLIRLRAKQDRTDKNYVRYFVQSELFKNQIENLKTGSTIQHFGPIHLQQIVYPSALASEQTQIANFLDHETAKIDTLIEKQQQLIKLLKEKRQAVISHAVTKGLNPQAPMKDSGVERLGKVPEHWKVVPLKYLCRFSGGGTPSKDNLSYWTNGTTPWVSPKDMKTFWIEKTQDYVTDIAVKESSTNLVEKGALLMVVRSGILQRTIPIAINTVPVTLNQDMKALRFNNRMLATFASDYILGNVDKLLLEWSKEGATVESIEHEYLANGLFPVPPIVEQRQIVEALTQQKERFDELEGKAIVGIKLLQERRTALISAAVTGKIDVRNWQAPTSQNQELEQTA